MSMILVCLSCLLLLVGSQPCSDQNTGMITEEWRTKLTIHFKMFDVNGDDILTHMEYVNETLGRARLSFKANKFEELSDIMEKAWYNFIRDSGTGNENDVHLEKFIRCSSRVLQSNEHFRREDRLWIRGVFRAADANNDGKLNLKEYKKLLRVLNVSRGITESFKFVDKDGNKIIEMAELVQANDNYFYNANSNSPLYGF